MYKSSNGNLWSESFGFKQPQSVNWSRIFVSSASFYPKYKPADLAETSAIWSTYGLRPTSFIWLRRGFNSILSSHWLVKSKFSWNPLSETNTERMIVDKVTEYPKTEHEFPGLFTVNFLPHPFLRLDGKSDYLGWFSKCEWKILSSNWLKFLILKIFEVFETYWKNRTAISICDLSNGKIERIDISKEHSLDLLDLTGNAILATQSNENEHR